MRTLSALTAATLSLLLATAPAFAVCELCTAEIRLDGGLAACFVQRAPERLKQLTDAGRGVAIIDLRDCGSRGGLPTGASDGDTPPVLDDRFVLDAAGLSCLMSAIETMTPSELSPSHVFDLVKDCPAN